MGDGTKENPYTREDILRLIKENDGIAEGLDLSGKVFEEEVNLSNLNLNNIILDRATLLGANFSGSRLMAAKLRNSKLRVAKFNKHGEGLTSHFAFLDNADFSDSDLTRAEFINAFLGQTKFNGANLREADFTLEGKREPDLLFTDFRDAELQFTNFTGRTFIATKLRGAYLNWTKITENVSLEDVEWQDFVIGEEENREYYQAENIYRRLKIWYTNAGRYDTAGNFFFREQEVKRKSIHNIFGILLKQRKFQDLLKLIFSQKTGIELIRLWLYKLLSGYGEKPWRVFAFGITVLIGLALLYYLTRGVTPFDFSLQSFLASLYYSSVSFTALGYGPWFSETSVRNWVQGFGAVEAIIGVFTMALFLVTFTRKMNR